MSLAGGGGAAAQEAAQERRAVPVVVLDLNRNRKFDVRPQADVYFDRDADGYAERGAWLAAGDGFLVIDRDGDGRISDGTELLAVGGTDGLAMLARAIGTQSGRITPHDKILWRDLRVWADIDQDGRSTAGELFTLADLGIQWIALRKGGARFARVIDGKRRVDAAGVVDLAYDPADRRRVTHVARMAQVAKLPDLPRMGGVPSLQEAMAQDHDGSNSAYALARRLAGMDWPLLFDDEAADLLERLLWRRAAIDNVPPDLYGGLIDARRVLLPAMLDGRAPATVRLAGFWDIYAAEKDYSAIMQQDAARFYFQSGAERLFTGAARNYNAETGYIGGVGGLDRTQLGAVIAVAAAIMDNEQRARYWTRVVAYIDQIIGVERLAPAEMGALDAALRAGRYDGGMTRMMRWGAVPPPVTIRAARQGGAKVRMNAGTESLGGVFAAAGQAQPDADRIILHDLATRALRQCCRQSEAYVLTALHQAGFKVVDITATVNETAHPLRAQGYARVLRATRAVPPAKKGMRAEQHSLVIYLRADGAGTDAVDWAEGMIVRDATE